jgi:superfamily II DNA or RNA helicase
MSRQLGHHRNLLVAATGTGKTVMAAVDYMRLREVLDRSRLLFVAHRKEILHQSLATFRQALRDAHFGELWVGGERPSRGDHVFASIQNLRPGRLEDIPPDHFDVVIVDEFHHAAAPSYEALLSRLKPRELLGLTATPERSDGRPLLNHFDDRIAAELRLWDAIDQGRLTPFQYYGIHDNTDLSAVPWTRGRGYDVEALTGLLTADDVWARRVLGEFLERCGVPGRARALGFCVSVDHARFMARVFRDQGVRALAIWGESPAEERAQALRDLDAGELQVLFAVDLFNEGVDLPRVDTLLMLRPTDSPVLFLQQLGRGLRRSRGKAACTVLDFVGHQRKDFRMDRRFRALLGGTRKELERQVEAGFPFLPAGCHLELEPVARDIVLRSIREAIPTRWAGKAQELRGVAASRGEVPLAIFLEESRLELSDIYQGHYCWSDLREAADLPVRHAGEAEEKLRRACGRMLHLNDPERFRIYRSLLAAKEIPDLPSLSERDRRLARMLVTSVAGAALSKSDDLQTGLTLLRAHPQIVAELLELFDVLEARPDHLQHSLESHPDVPLLIHARYTRAEILAAFGVGGKGARVNKWQTGVQRVRDARADLLAFTLDKTAKSFSPTTRYRDYAISRELIHWESQNVVREDSETGRLYQEHEGQDWKIMLFARKDTTGKDFWFLGPATYVSHQGEKPMAITWHLEVPLPGDLFLAFAAAVA